MTDRNGLELAIGDTVRTVAWRGHVAKADAGRNLTVRALKQTVGALAGLPGLLADDGDPKNPDIATNGFTCSMWLPSGAVERVGGAR